MKQKRFKEDDWELLSPAFRYHLLLLVADVAGRLGGATHRPLLADGFRTLEQSAKTNAAGKSQLAGPSMHCYRIAGDLICPEHFWDCAKHGCRFFDVLHQCALARGFTRVYLGKGSKRWIDGPHVQAVPVREQNYVRRANAEEIELLVVKYLGAVKT